MDYAPLSDREERIGEAIVDAAYSVHKTLGPGLLENVYCELKTAEEMKAVFTAQQYSMCPGTMRTGCVY